MTFRQFWCGLLRGHDAVLHFENQKTGPCIPMMRCTSCLWDSPGMVPGPKAYRQTYAGDPRRHQLTGRNVLKIRRRA